MDRCGDDAKDATADQREDPGFRGVPWWIESWTDLDREGATI